MIQHLISEDIAFERDLKFKYNPKAVNYYKEDQKSIKAEKLKLLDNAEYREKENETITIKPDQGSIKFTGPIYVLQDDFVYSSANNFSSFCLK